MCGEISIDQEHLNKIIEKANEDKDNQHKSNQEFIVRPIDSYTHNNIKGQEVTRTTVAIVWLNGKIDIYNVVGDKKPNCIHTIDFTD